MGHVAVEKQTRCGWSHQRPRANQRVVALHQPIDSPDVRTAHTRDTLYVSCCSNFHAARSPHPHCCIVLSPVNRVLANHCASPSPNQRAHSAHHAACMI
jgi:hypothetical protein